MSLLFTILFYSFLGSIVSLVGGLGLVMRKKKFSHHQSLLVISFAAGVLLATAILDLMPEAAEHFGVMKWEWVLAGIVGLFLFEKSWFWFHHHEDEFVGDASTPSAIMIGDTVHNFIDGVVIAGAFLVSVPTGIVTSLAVAAHEIPHEMADFGVLLAKGWEKRKIILLNIASAAVSLIGAVAAYTVGSTVEAIVPYLLAFSAGMFIYLACSDLIPELHHCHGQECDIHNNWPQVAVFLGGIFLIGFMVRFLE